MNRAVLAVGIMLLFIITSVAPMVIGYISDDDIRDERDMFLENSAFMCYDERGNNAKYEYYKEHLLNDYLNSDIEIVEDKREVVTPILSSPVTMSDGPMDSAWSMQSHDVHHTGRSPYETGNNPDGLEKWRFCDDH